MIRLAARMVGGRREARRLLICDQKRSDGPCGHVLDIGDAQPRRARAAARQIGWTRVVVTVRGSAIDLCREHSEVAR